MRSCWGQQPCPDNWDRPTLSVSTQYGQHEQWCLNSCHLLTVLLLAALGQSSALATINVQDYGAVPDGITDDSEAISHALRAAYGPFDAYPLNNCQEIFFPHGVYLVKPSTLHLVHNLSGCGMHGEGAYSSVVKLTARSGYAVTHDESLDGQLQFFHIREMGFYGPGSSSELNWYHEKGTGGDGGLLVEDVMIHGFNEGYQVEGTAAADTASFIHIGVDDINIAFHLNNQQSVPYELISSSVCANDDVFLFDQYGASGWHVVGGYLCVLKTGSIFHYSHTFRGGQNNQNLTVTGTHFELLAPSTRLTTDDASQAPFEFSCYGCNSDTALPNDNRSTIFLRGGARMLWTGGMLGGLVTLDLNGSGSSPVIFSLTDADWDTGGVPPSAAITIEGKGQALISFHAVQVVGHGIIPNQ
jgi:hypothetical protein